MAQTVNRSPLEFASRSLHMDFLVDEKGLGRFFSGLLPFSSLINFIPQFLHSHHFIGLCYGAADVVGWHPCYSLTF